MSTSRFPTWRLPWRMLTLAPRALLATWPVLAAWFLVGQLTHYWVIQGAGFLGAFNSLAGVLLMPLAVTAKLIAIVAILLSMRAQLVQLGAIAPRPEEGKARRKAFANALIAGVLPFIGFYALQGYLQDDWNDYVRRAMEVRMEHQFYTDQEGLPQAREWDFVVGEVVLGWSVLVLILGAFAARMAVQKLKTKYPRLGAPVVIYLESLWVFLTALAINEYTGSLGAWTQQRQAMVWLDSLQTWVADHLSWLMWIWEGLITVIGYAGAALFLPIAWLTIAGTVYGVAVQAQAPKLAGAKALGKVGGRVGEKTAGTYQRFKESKSWWATKGREMLTMHVTGRFTPIINALVLAWRAGPLLIAAYAVIFMLIGYAEPWLGYGVTRLIGPMDYDFYVQIAPALGIGIALAVEPVRLALVAAAYDTALVRLATAPPTAAEEPETVEATPEEPEPVQAEAASQSPQD